jgi:GTPase SAR1 family protein
VPCVPVPVQHLWGDYLGAPQPAKAARASGTAARAVGIGMRSPSASRPSPDSRRSPLPQTIGASFAMKKYEANGRPCNLGIWVRRRPPTRLRARPEGFCSHACRPFSQDTAGQERFDSLSSFYCRGARAAIICFDLTDRSDAAPVLPAPCSARPG